MRDHIQAQAPICPYCFDDHSSLTDCDVKDLKKRILNTQIEIYDRSKNNEKQDGSIFTTIKRMIDYL